MSHHERIDDWLMDTECSPAEPCGDCHGCATRELARDLVAALRRIAHPPSQTELDDLFREGE